MAKARQAEKTFGALKTGVEGLTIVEGSRGLGGMNLSRGTQGHVGKVLGMASKSLGNVTGFAKSIAGGAIGLSVIGRALKNMIDLV